MQLANIAARLMKPFANSGNKAAIPQTGTDPARASYETGFTPLNMTPIAAGGVPPSGRDMNGILYDLSNAMMWQQAMGILPYDATVSYPNGALVVYGGMLWKCLADDTLNVTPVNGAKWTSDIHTGYVKKTGDTITGTLTAPTAPAGTNTTQLATSAFVQRALGNFRSNQTINVTTTLTLAHVGSVILFNGAAGQTFTLPLSSDCNSGSAIHFRNMSSNNVTIQRQGANVIVAGTSTGLTSLTLKPGEAISFYTPTDSWYAISGSGTFQYETGFGSSLSANGWQRLPSGLIIQWGAVSVSAVNGNYQAALYPIRFPNTCFQVVGGRDALGSNAVMLVGRAGGDPTGQVLFQNYAASTELGKYFAIGY